MIRSQIELIALRSSTVNGRAAYREWSQLSTSKEHSRLKLFRSHFRMLVAIIYASFAAMCANINSFPFFRLSKSKSNVSAFYHSK